MKADPESCTPLLRIPRLMCDPVNFKEASFPYKFKAWLLESRGEGCFAKVMITKVDSALLEEATIHLIWKVRLENVLGEKGKK